MLKLLDYLLYVCAAALTSLIAQAIFWVLGGPQVTWGSFIVGALVVLAVWSLMERFKGKRNA